MTSSQDSTGAVSGAAVWFMSLAAALGTATVYPLQPAIADVSTTFGSSVGAVGAALACGPVGYLLGLVLLVPLVDRYPPRFVLSLQFGGLAVAMSLGAASGTTWGLGLTMLLIGACSSVGAGLSSVVGRVARPDRRSTSLGIVTAGISAGILTGRIIGGWLADLIGWQQMLLVFAGASAFVALLGLLFFPSGRAEVRGGYLATVGSIPGLLRRHSVLRSASLLGAMWFFAFCAVWSGIAVALSAEPYSLSAEQIGIYGLAGIAGMVATRAAGSWTDRVGSRKVILAGLLLALLACLVLTFGLSNTPVVLVCLALFDAGLFAAQVANQSSVLAIDPNAPARFNSAYMVIYFIGGSLGTAYGAAVVHTAGWPRTVLVCATAIAAACLLTWRGVDRSRNGTTTPPRQLRGENSQPASRA